MNYKLYNYKVPNAKVSNANKYRFRRFDHDKMLSYSRIQKNRVKWINFSYNYQVYKFIITIINYRHAYKKYMYKTVY